MGCGDSIIYGSTTTNNDVDVTNEDEFWECVRHHISEYCISLFDEYEDLSLKGKILEVPNLNKIKRQFPKHRKGR